MKTKVEKGDRLAKQLADNFEHPLDLMFLSPDGRLISRLNSFHDFPEVHPDVTCPPFKRRGQPKLQSHADVFMEHMAAHFGGG